MLSLPRDLLVDIPGHGQDKMNAAYAYGGPRLVVKTFKQLTGLQINHFIQVDFGGFWHVVNILGGVYLPVDHRYFVPASADYKSIDLQPGYQLVRGKQALNFVRFRHDQYGDFTRMQRQQLFLRELQRQSGRWSGDWSRVLRLIRAITHQTRSDLDSLRKLEPLVELAFQVDASKVYSVHVEGSTPTINGVSYVTASAGEIAKAVEQFTDPAQAPIAKSAAAVPKRLYRVTVHGADAAAVEKTAAALRARGYTVAAAADGVGRRQGHGRLRARGRSRPRPTLLGAMLWPSDVQVVKRAPGTLDGVEVFLGTEATGSVRVPKAGGDGSGTTLQQDVRTGWSSWTCSSRGARRCACRRPPPGRPAPRGTSSGTTRCAPRRAGAWPPPWPSRRRRGTATGASRRCAGPTRRRWLIPRSPRPSAAARTSSSTRDRTCTSWRGRSAARCTGWSTRWTTSSPTT